MFADPFSLVSPLKVKDAANKPQLLPRPSTIFTSIFHSIPLVTISESAHSLPSLNIVLFWQSSILFQFDQPTGFLRPLVKSLPRGTVSTLRGQRILSPNLPGWAILCFPSREHLWSLKIRIGSTGIISHPVERPGKCLLITSLCALRATMSSDHRAGPLSSP